MGVKQCFRRGCDNIMCNRYSDKHNYICNECFDELVRKGGNISISKFMETVKPETVDSATEEACRIYYATIFRRS